MVSKTIDNKRQLQFSKEAKNASHAVKTLSSDNGDEFDNKDVPEAVDKNGVIQLVTMTYT